MSNRYFKVAFFVFVCIFSSIGNSDARDIIDDRRNNVAMRMIGHEVLLQAGDSSSLVLPVEKVGERYHIQFGSEIKFFPQKMKEITNRAIKETGIASSYRVEIEKVGTNGIAYSYEIGNTTVDDMLPCAGRNYERGNYSIFITILEVGGAQETPSLAALDRLYSSNEKQATGYFKFGALNISLLLLIGFFIFMWKKRTQAKPNINPNIISLGAYQFDKKTMELSLDNEKTELTAKESDLLLLLHSSANTTLEREKLLEKVWGDEGDYVGRTLDVFISKLRKKLEADSSVKIVNIRGVGYKLVMD